MSTAVETKPAAAEAIRKALEHLPIHPIGAFYDDGIQYDSFWPRVHALVEALLEDRDPLAFAAHNGLGHLDDYNNLEVGIVEGAFVAGIEYGRRLAAIEALDAPTRKRVK